MHPSTKETSTPSEQFQSPISQTPELSRPVSTEQDADWSTNSTLGAAPQHPVPSMQGPFEESFEEAQISEDWMLPIESQDACQRRETMLQTEDESSNGTLNAQWRQQAHRKYHPLLKVFAQLAFGMDLLYSDNAQDDHAVMRVMRRHMLDLHLYLKSLVEDLMEGLTDVCERTGYLRLTLEYEPVLETMLESPRISEPMAATISSVKRVIRYTLTQTEDAEMDVKEGREACEDLIGFLDDIASDCSTGRPLQQAVHVYLGQESNQWMQKFDEVELGAKRLKTATHSLQSVVNELESRIRLFQAKKTKPLPPGPPPVPKVPKVVVRTTESPCSSSPKGLAINCQSSPKPSRQAPKIHLEPREPTYSADRVADLVSFFSQTPPPSENTFPELPIATPDTAETASSGGQSSFSLGFLSGSRLLASISGSKPTASTPSVDKLHLANEVYHPPPPPQPPKAMKPVRAKHPTQDDSAQPILAVTSVNTYHSVEPGPIKQRPTQAGQTATPPKRRRAPVRRSKVPEVMSVTSPESVLQASQGWVADSLVEDESEKEEEGASTVSSSKPVGSENEQFLGHVNNPCDHSPAESSGQRPPEGQAPQIEAQAASRSDSRESNSKSISKSEKATPPTSVIDTVQVEPESDKPQPSPHKNVNVLTPVSPAPKAKKESNSGEGGDAAGKFECQPSKTRMVRDVNSPGAHVSGAPSSGVSVSRSTRGSRSSLRRNLTSDTGKQPRCSSGIKPRSGSLSNTRFGLFPTPTLQEQALEQARRSLSSGSARQTGSLHDYPSLHDSFFQTNIVASLGSDRLRTRPSSKGSLGRRSSQLTAIGDIATSKRPDSRTEKVEQCAYVPSYSVFPRTPSGRSAASKTESMKDARRDAMEIADPSVVTSLSKYRLNFQTADSSQNSISSGEQCRRSATSSIISQRSRQSMPTLTEPPNIAPSPRPIGSTSEVLATPATPSTPMSTALSESKNLLQRPSVSSIITAVRRGSEHRDRPRTSTTEPTNPSTHLSSNSSLPAGPLTHPLPDKPPSSPRRQNDDNSGVQSQLQPQPGGSNLLPNTQNKTKSQKGHESGPHFSVIPISSSNQLSGSETSTSAKLASLTTSPFFSLRQRLRMKISSRVLDENLSSAGSEIVS